LNVRENDAYLVLVFTSQAPYQAAGAAKGIGNVG